MSEKLPVISGKDLLALLIKAGFIVVRIKGSHHRLKHLDKRVVTIPVHKNEPLPPGLLRSIIRDDLKISVDQFRELITQFH